MLLIFVSAVTDFAETVKEDGTGKAFSHLAFVALLGGFALQLGIVEPVECEKRPLHPTKYMQCHGHAILSRIGRELAHYHLRSDLSRANRLGDTGSVPLVVIKGGRLLVAAAECVGQGEIGHLPDLVTRKGIIEGGRD